MNHFKPGDIITPKKDTTKNSVFRSNTRLFEHDTLTASYCVEPNDCVLVVNEISYYPTWELYDVEKEDIITVVCVIDKTGSLLETESYPYENWELLYSCAKDVVILQ